MEIKYTKFKLSNGIRVFMVPKKETKAVSIEILFGAGSRYETAEISGIAHFLEHMAFKGTKKRPTTLDISREIDQVGGSFNAYTGEDMTGYWIRLQSEKLELAMDILSDMILNSKFEEKEITREKGVILEEMKMYNDNPRYLAGIKFQELIYGDTPLGRNIVGTEKTVKAIDRKKMIEFRSKFYNPDNMVIAIGGNINQKETKDLLEKYFNKIKGKTKESFEKNEIKQNKSIVKIYKKDVEQVNLAMGFRSFDRNHKDRYIQGLLAKILGGYMSSKLYIEVREKKGLAYSVSAFTDSYHDTGCFGIGGGFDPKKTPDAIREILKILREVKKKGFSEKEINMAKENSVGKLVLSLEGASGWASSLAYDELYGMPIEMPDEIIAKTKKVSNKDIIRVANEIFKAENFNMVIVGPIDEKKEKEYLELVKL